MARRRTKTYRMLHEEARSRDGTLRPRRNRTTRGDSFDPILIDSGAARRGVHARLAGAMLAATLACACAAFALFGPLDRFSLLSAIATGVIDWKEQPPPATVEQIVSFYEKHAQQVDDRLAKLDDAGWNKPGKFLYGGTPVWEDTVGELMWGHLLDAIHHRGQLSTYLRPMGSKVPSIYGPSADDSGQ